MAGADDVLSFMFLNDKKISSFSSSAVKGSRPRFWVWGKLAYHSRRSTNRGARNKSHYEMANLSRAQIVHQQGRNPVIACLGPDNLEA
jgi:hypothetical protein